MSEPAEEKPTVTSLELKTIRVVTDLFDAAPGREMHENVLAFLMAKYWPYGKWERGA